MESTSLSLVKLVLQEHVGVDGETDARLENVFDACALLEESVDDGGAWWDHGGLEHVAEDGEDGVELLEGLAGGWLHRDTFAQFGEDDEVEDEWGGEKRVFAGVVHGDGVVSSEEDLAGVLVEGSLAVADVGNVLDDDDVIRVFVGLVQEAVGGDHIVHDVALADLLGAELLWCRQVLSVVVTQVVVADDGGRLESCGDEEVNHDRLHLGLTTLEVVSSDGDVVVNGEVDNSGHERVLWASVDVRASFEDTGNSEHARGRDFVFSSLESGHEVLLGVIESGDDVAEAFSVSGPDDDDLVDVVLLSEVSDVSTKLLYLLDLGAFQDVVGAVLLVGGDEVWDVDGRQRGVLLHVGEELSLEVVVEHLSALHGLSEVQLGDIPTSEDDIVGGTMGTTDRSGT